MYCRQRRRGIDEVLDAERSEVTQENAQLGPLIERQVTAAAGACEAAEALAALQDAQVTRTTCHDGR